MNRLFGKKVYVDTNVFIFFAENHPAFAHPIREVFFAFAQGRLTLATSEVTLAEVLVMPMRRGRRDLIKVYDELLAPRPGFDCVPASKAILRRSATMRAATSFKLVDAIHLATAAEAGCDVLLTEDQRLSMYPVSCLLVSKIRQQPPATP